MGELLHARAEACGEDLLDNCAEITGEQTSRPLGIAFVLALRTLIGSGILPDGAIMVSHSATWMEEPPLGEQVTTDLMMSRAEGPRERYRRVVLSYVTRGGDGRVLIKQEQEVLWPTS